MEDPNVTHITVVGGHICYLGNIVTPTGSLYLVNIIINSVLSCCNAHFVCFYAKYFYLKTPMYRPEYVHIKRSDILQDFIE